MKKILSLSLCLVLLFGCFSTYAAKEESPSLIRANEVWKMKDALGKTITGKGIKVGIIDTGIDPKHPMFKDVKIHGYDFTTNTSKLTDTQGHGTHVAGIVHRIAPDASLYIYRIDLESANDQKQNPSLFKAIDQAIKDKVHVLNLSLGEDKNIPTEPLITALDRAVKSGIVVVCANGNDGSNRWTVGTPASSANVLSVGASTKKIGTPYLQFVGDKKEMGILPLRDSSRFRMKGSYPTHFAKDRKDLTNVKGKVVFLDRFKKMDVEKIVEKADQAGAVALILCNTHKGEYVHKSKYFLPLTIPVATLCGESSSYIKQQFSKGKHVQFVTHPKEEVAPFSSRGPVLGSWEIKPDVVAPGADILSAVPKEVDKTGYAYESGTSMAAPQVSGAVALVRQAHPDWTVEQVKCAFANTAVSLQNSLDHRAAFIAQGSGRIDVVKAMNTTSFAMPNSLTFGKLSPESGVKNIHRSLSIQNISSAKKKYAIQACVNTTVKGIQLHVPITVDVQGKSSTPLSVQMTVDTNTVPAGIYTGTIKITEKQNQLRVPFIVLVEPKNYHKVEGLMIEELIEKKNLFQVTYYLSSLVDRIEMWVEDKKTSKKHPIYHTRPTKIGYVKWMWNGKTTNGKSLPDGRYVLKAKYIHQGKSIDVKSEIENLTGPKKTSTIDRTPPKLILDTTGKNTLKGAAYDTLTGVKKVSWKLAFGTKWTNVKLINQGNTSRFSYTFNKNQLKYGKNMIVVRAEDNYGNVSTKSVTIYKK